jgi:hypothetical protein
MSHLPGSSLIPNSFYRAKGHLCCRTPLLKGVGSGGCTYLFNKVSCLPLLLVIYMLSCVFVGVHICASMVVGVCAHMS